MMPVLKASVLRHSSVAINSWVTSGILNGSLEFGRSLRRPHACRVQRQLRRIRLGKGQIELGALETAADLASIFANLDVSGPAVDDDKAWLADDRIVVL